MWLILTDWQINEGVLKVWYHQSWSWVGLVYVAGPTTAASAARWAEWTEGLISRIRRDWRVLECIMQHGSNCRLEAKPTYRITFDQILVPYVGTLWVEVKKNYAGVCDNFGKCWNSSFPVTFWDELRKRNCITYRLTSNLLPAKFESVAATPVSSWGSKFYVDGLQFEECRDSNPFSDSEVWGDGAPTARAISSNIL